MKWNEKNKVSSSFSLQGAIIRNGEELKWKVYAQREIVDVVKCRVCIGALICERKRRA